MKVLYVLGFGRSGSTLLDLVLGETDGFFSAGELQSLWRESLLDGRRCGCGADVAACPLWSEILGGPDCPLLGAAPQEIATLQAERLRLPATGPRFSLGRACDADWRVYLGVLERLYGRISDVTQAKVIVDSSKLPSVAAALQRLSSVEIYYLQLVRDPRAVAYSWMRKKAATDRRRGGQMERISATRSATTWMARQLAAERVRALAPDRSMLLRYEDFARSPHRSAARVAALVGEPLPPGTSGDEATMVLSPNHTVSGNPVRLRCGPIQIREDLEWISCLPARARATVTATCWPLLKRYGYA